MARPHSGGVVRLIQTLWDAGTAASLNDAELLGRFLRRDAIAEAAFAALVRRHAPMVLRVCRDVTGDPHDAEDAAQVTFLVLALKARSIRRGETLANWLFGTARRVAARGSATRPAAAVTSGDTPSRRGATSVGGYRGSDGVGRSIRGAGPFARCYRAADRPVRPGGPDPRPGRRALGCPLRTLQTRLYRGRERLRERLIRVA